ncbi:hypothetical protein FLBR109950_04480 [Flavobacterium branchiophilum]|uniref:Uncharacterized protein n=1 Tax=Flavobacterium branchiophilum (strain FL-15) TaxID=1034807 RepID=G2Z6H9_FLABF|nr:Hypothetical protein FBFL15_3065 [Flavobacterium branchiophilum FL-15]
MTYIKVKSKRKIFNRNEISEILAFQRCNHLDDNEVSLFFKIKPKQLQRLKLIHHKFLTPISLFASSDEK